jgi:hypothetical protein
MKTKEQEIPYVDTKSGHLTLEVGKTYLNGYGQAITINRRLPRLEGVGDLFVSDSLGYTTSYLQSGFKYQNLDANEDLSEEVQHNEN